MEGTLKAISIQTYGLFNKKGKEIHKFTIKDPKKRGKIDVLQNTVVTIKQLQAALKD